jgi:hypothetical protein
MPSPVAAQALKLILELVPLVVEVFTAALAADDPKDALVKARAAARMAAVKKARGAAVRGTR